MCIFIILVSVLVLIFLLLHVKFFAFFFRHSNSSQSKVTFTEILIYLLHVQRGVNDVFGGRRNTKHDRCEDTKKCVCLCSYCVDESLGVCVQNTLSDTV